MMKQGALLIILASVAFLQVISWPSTLYAMPSSPQGLPFTPAQNETVSTGVNTTTTTDTITNSSPPENSTTLDTVHTGGSITQPTGRTEPNIVTLASAISGLSPYVAILLWAGFILGITTISIASSSTIIKNRNTIASKAKQTIEWIVKLIQPLPSLAPQSEKGAKFQWFLGLYQLKNTLKYLKFTLWGSGGTLIIASLVSWNVCGGILPYLGSGIGLILTERGIYLHRITEQIQLATEPMAQFIHYKFEIEQTS